jgi:signal transduction histidine kinase
VAAFIDDIAATGLLHSEYREIQFTIERIDPTLSIDADPQLLASAVTNLLHNAFTTELGSRESGVSVP